MNGETKGLHRASALQYSKIRATVNAVLSDEEWQQIRRDAIAKIWDFLDHMRAGEFGVNPSRESRRPAAFAISPRSVATTAIASMGRSGQQITRIPPIRSLRSLRVLCNLRPSRS